MRSLFRSLPIGVLLSAAVISCRSGDSGPTAPDDNLIRIGGTYATQVTLGQSSCPNIAVQDMETTVTHSPGSMTFALRHASISAAGSVQADGGFSTEKVDVAVGQAMHNYRISGKFTVNGFQAILTITVTQPVSPASCVYQLAWIGTKQGARNTIPGP